MRKILFFIVFVCSTLAVMSQNYYFSDSLYLQELDALLKPTYNIHPEVEEEYNLFVLNWESGKLDNNKFGIVYVSNSLKDNYAKAYPHFYQYISTINALVEKQDLNYYTEWEVGLLSVTMTNKIRNISDFLQSSNLLIKDSILVQSPSVTWKVTSTDYTINNDPNTEKLFISFNSDVDILCYNTDGNTIDTFYIKQTTGTCYPSEKKYYGSYGRIPWTQVKYDSDKVFAKFDKFEVDMQQSRLVIDTAYFTNEDINLFQEPGKLEVKLYQQNANDVSPIFESFNVVTVDDFFDDVVFTGYITMKGVKFLGVGGKNPAQITIYDTGTRIATLKGTSFDITKDKMIYSVSTDVSFLFNSMQDSIWHQNLIVRYQQTLDSTLYKPRWFNYSDQNGPFLIIQRTSSGLGLSPFADTYHKMDIYSERAIWKKSDSLLFFLTTRSSSLDYAYFESQDYFSQGDYDYFSGATSDGFNHLAAIRNLRDMDNTVDYISIEDYQTYLKNEYGKQIALQSIQNLFQQLSYASFVTYDRVNKCINTTPKIDRYLSNSARVRLKSTQHQDFDDLRMFSDKKDSVNAKLNLNSYDLKINSVKPFWITSKIQVFSKEITVQQNRELNFAGDVSAGLTLYHGDDFKFNYDNFDFEILSPASARIAVVDTNNKSKLLSTELKNITGIIEINDDNNKSNTIDNKTNYPLLKTNAKARITYSAFAALYGNDDVNAFDSIFYFEADNFNLDSLTSLKDTSLTFKGKMFTGLFDPLEVELSVKTDHKGNKSLGFTKCTAQDSNIVNGLKFKDGKFFGCFELNDAGLFGDGYIIYASSYVHSTSFAFLPNEVIAVADTVIIDKQSYSQNNNENIPLVTGFNVGFDWRDLMEFSSSANADLLLYSDKLQNPGDLAGKLYYTNNKMFGSGTFQFLDADIIDTNFVFKSSNFEAKTCDFNLKVGQNTTFKTHNLNGNVDIDQEIGSFYSNDDTTRIVFEDNRYVCIMDHFLWKIGEGIVNIGGVMPGQDTSNYVTSIDDKIAQKQNNSDVKLFGTILVGMNDTLTFNAASTTYKLDEGIIVADDVQKIKIADAMIYPKGKVTILKFGQIDTIKNISFDFPYKVFDNQKNSNYIYSMHNSDVYITNRFNYTAFSPKYYYPFKSQLITFDNVKVVNAPRNIDKRRGVDFADLKSYGKKSTSQLDSIMLDNDFIYEGAGEIEVYADKPHLVFEGYIKFDSTCNGSLIPIKPIRFRPDTINYQKVILPIEPIHGSRRGEVVTGLYWGLERVNNKQTYFINFPFVGSLDGSVSIGTDNARVWPIFQPSGFLAYNSKTGEYRIGSEDVLYSTKADTINKNLFAYNKNLCLVKGQGEFNLFMPWEVGSNKNIDDIISNFKGFYRNDLSDQNQEFQGMWELEFISPDYVMNNLANLCVDNFDNISTFDPNNIQRTTKNYIMFFGKENADKMIYDMQTNYDYFLPDSLDNAAIVFSDIQLRYNADSSALVSVGPLGIASINGKKVDRYIKGYVKYRLHPRTRMLIIILEPAPGKIFAFKYRYSGNGNMDIYVNTGNNVLDEYVSRMKDKDKRFRNYSIIDADEHTFKVFAPEYF